MPASHFEIETVVRWAEADINGHMRNSSYLDLASHSRISFFASHGFNTKTFFEKQIGPVVFHDDLQYRHESFLGDSLTVRLSLAGISEKGFSFAFRNEFRRPDGTLTAVLNSKAGWLDLRARKLINPPVELLEIMSHLRRTDDFKVLRDRAES